jgi:hypothetical protein
LQADLLVAMMNQMTPEELGKLVSKTYDPEAFLPNKLFDQRGVGYRGNLPIQLSQLRPGMGSNPITTGSEGRTL